MLIMADNMEAFGDFAGAVLVEQWADADWTGQLRE